jgi:hypothetical protein
VSGDGPRRRFSNGRLFVYRSTIRPVRPRERWRPVPRKESLLMKTGRNVPYSGAVAAVLALALVAGLRFRNDNAVVAPPTSPTPTSSVTTATSASPIATASPTPSAATAGAITGRFGYPSDFIPALTVYALSVDDPKVFFSVDFAGVGNPPRATLPPGVSQAT